MKHIRYNNPLNVPFKPANGIVVTQDLERNYGIQDTNMLYCT